MRIQSRRYLTDTRKTAGLKLKDAMEEIMKHKLTNDLAITVIPPESASDVLSLTITKNDIAIARLCLDANQSAAMISDLKNAFNDFVN